MRRYRPLCIACLLVLAGFLRPPAACGGEILDRLFFTRKDRAHLEQLRWAAAESPGPVREDTKTTAATEGTPQVFTLEGTVTKKHEVQALWLNSVKYTGTGLPKNVELHPPFTAGQILLRVPKTGTSYVLRPGQSVDIGDGRIREAYERAPAAPAADSASARKPAPPPEAPAKAVQTPKAPPQLQP